MFYEYSQDSRHSPLTVTGDGTHVENSFIINTLSPPVIPHSLLFLKLLNSPAHLSIMTVSASETLNIETQDLKIISKENTSHNMHS